MRINRETTHEALHAIGAKTVWQISSTEFEVEPDVDIALLDSAEAEVNKERQRQDLKHIRDEALRALTHTLTDGSVYQTRPQDMQNFDLAIAIGQDREWVLADNSVRMTTVAELQEIRGAGITQGQAVWDRYIADLALL